MPFSTILVNYFNQGRDKLEYSTALLNEYAKYMQSPNIPKNVHLPIALDNTDLIQEQDRSVIEWFNELEAQMKRTTNTIPLFFPIDYHTHDNKYLSTIHKGEDKWIKALLASEDKMYNMYSRIKTIDVA